MSDIVERLRGFIKCNCEPGETICNGCSAIEGVDDEIRSLRSRLAEELAAQDFTYNRKTNDLIERHAKQIESLRSRLAEAESRLNLAEAEVTMLRHFYAEAEALLLEVRADLHEWCQAYESPQHTLQLMQRIDEWRKNYEPSTSNSPPSFHHSE